MIWSVILLFVAVLAMIGGFGCVGRSIDARAPRRRIVSDPSLTASCVGDIRSARRLEQKSPDENVVPLRGSRRLLDD